MKWGTSEREVRFMLQCVRLPEKLFLHSSSLFSESPHCPWKNASTCFIFKHKSQSQCLEGLGR